MSTFHAPALALVMGALSACSSGAPSASLPREPTLSAASPSGSLSPEAKDAESSYVEPCSVPVPQREIPNVDIQDAVAADIEAGTYDGFSVVGAYPSYAGEVAVVVTGDREKALAELRGPEVLNVYRLAVGIDPEVMPFVAMEGRVSVMWGKLFRRLRHYDGFAGLANLPEIGAIQIRWRGSVPAEVSALGNTTADNGIVILPVAHADYSYREVQQAQRRVWRSPVDKGAGGFVGATECQDGSAVRMEIDVTHPHRRLTWWARKLEPIAGIPVIIERSGLGVLAGG